MNKKQIKFLVIVLAIFIGLIIWLAVANRSLRGDIKDLKKENKGLHVENKQIREENKALEKDIAAKDNQIAEGTMIFDSLKTTLEKLNNKSIVTVHENYNTVTTLDLDGQISFLSRFLESAGDSR